jgi:O-antigen ligase
MKLYRQIFWLLVLFLPIQLGRHFWFNWSRVLGLPVDYLSPTLYLTDLLVFLILLFWFWSAKKKFSRAFSLRTLKKNWWLGAIFLFLFVNVFLASNQATAFFKLIKILELVLLAFYLVNNKYRLADLHLPLSLAIIYTSLMAFFQFIKQASLGGFFWWLGERSFNLLTPGIAKAIVGGRLILRPYATFSHPNALGGFLLVSLILVGWPKKKKNSPFWLTLILGGMALVLSFSRLIWFASLLIGFGWLLFPRLAKGKSFLIWFFFLMIFSSLFFFLTLPLSGLETLNQRLALTKEALEMIKTYPLAGVGLNNFISQLPSFWQPFGQTYWLQPVHNLFLLIAAETGLPGLLIFLWLLILTFRRLLAKNHWRLILALALVLFLGLFDHYWLTLQSPQLLLSLIFGLSWSQ